jgi:predicted protein tyrosine phosphatase
MSETYISQQQARDALEELAEVREQRDELLAACELARSMLNVECCDGCTCGDGWDHPSEVDVKFIDEAIKKAS